MSGIIGDIFGGGESTTTVVNSTPAPSQEELDLMRLSGDLARLQIQNITDLQPLQRELLGITLAEARRQIQVNTARDAVMTPERLQEQADLEEQINRLGLENMVAEGERSRRLGPIQEELLNMQLEELRRGGRATPEQIAQIERAANAGIAAGSADIDASTQRGIGMISDELANSRGLRLSDSPMTGEAALLAREGQIQKGSLIKNMRAGQASAELNFPLAVQQLQSGINMSQQQIGAAASQFQADLRQRAFQNRLALTGQTIQGGIGMASIGDGGAGLNAMAGNRFRNTTQTSTGSQPFNLSGIGGVMSGIGAIGGLFSDRRLKDDYGVVAKTESGLDLHLFKYKGEGKETPLRLGVMAQDVAKVKPGAVGRHSSGYLTVDYTRI